MRLRLAATGWRPSRQSRRTLNKANLSALLPLTSRSLRTPSPLSSAALTGDIVTRFLCLCQATKHRTSPLDSHCSRGVHHRRPTGCFLLRRFSVILLPCPQPLPRTVQRRSSRVWVKPPDTEASPLSSRSSRGVITGDECGWGRAESPSFRRRAQGNVALMAR